MGADFLLDVAGRYALLTPEDEIELGRAIRLWQDHPDGPDGAPGPIRKAGKRALDKFLLCNLRLAHYVARRYLGRGVPLEDLMQAASEGLMQAYRRFDPTLGYRSSSYAIWWAQQSCQVLVAQQGNGLRLPTTVSEKLRKMEKCHERLSTELNRAPSSAELEERTGMNSQQVHQLKAVRRSADVLSLDRHAKGLGDGDSRMRTPVLEAVPGSEDPRLDLERQHFKELLRQLVDTSPQLTPQQRVLLQCRYLTEAPPSIAKLASELQMNRETLRRAEKAALQILKGLLPAETLAYRELL